MGGGGLCGGGGFTFMAEVRGFRVVVGYGGGKGGYGVRVAVWGWGVRVMVWG